MKTGDKFTVERCLTGYIVTAGNPLAIRAANNSSNLQFQEGLTSKINAFTHKEHVLDFLRIALTLDCETGLAKEIKK